MQDIKTLSKKWYVLVLPSSQQVYLTTKWIQRDPCWLGVSVVSILIKLQPQSFQMGRRNLGGGTWI